MTKLLILSSDTGEGHNSAARAIESSALAAGLDVSVRKPIEASGRLNRGLGGLYNTLLAQRPQWMRNYFWLVDHLRPNERDFLYSQAREYIGRFLDLEKPEVLLSVHPMLNHFIQRFIKEEGLGVTCHTFLTDPFPPFWHGWASPYVDRFFVPTAEALQALTAMGVAAWRIERVPMPVRPQFRPIGAAERSSFLSEIGLDAGSTILLNGGARGGGPLLGVYKAIRRAAPRINVIAICGRNELLRQRIESMGHVTTRAFGFVEDIHRYIAASNLVVTKPGALSTYETLACGVPVLMLGVRGLMPQESGMFRAARHYDFGFAAARLKDVENIINLGSAAWDRRRESVRAFYERSSGEELIDRIRHQHAA